MTDQEIKDAIENLNTFLMERNIKTHKGRLIDKAHEELERAEMAANPHEEADAISDAIFWYKRALEY